MSNITRNHAEAEEQTPASAAVSANSPETVSIDAPTLLERCFGNPAFAISLLAEVESTWLNRVEQIQNFAEREEFSSMAEVAHTLKGAAALMCAESIRKIAADIELAGRSSNGDGLETKTRNLSAEMQQCLNGLPMLKEELQFFAKDSAG